jgi:hypothetical protein
MINTLYRCVFVGLLHKYKNIFGLDRMFVVDITVNSRESSIQVFEEKLEIEFFLNYDL